MRTLLHEFSDSAIDQCEAAMKMPLSSELYNSRAMQQQKAVAAMMDTVVYFGMEPEEE
jgi:hypothetical protein